MATRAGLLAFIRSSMGISSVYLPDNSTDIDNAFALSQEQVALEIQPVSQLLFDQATYSLGGHILVKYASDQTGQTFFSNLRTQYNINGFVAGVVNSASDQGTGEGLTVPKFFDEFQMSDLDNVKTPWGRDYLAIAQKMMYNWGIS